ncbi:unnamed protein product [marine sediment metagenome]|uniref:Helix-turn-helix domain-containing protein n=1 Tax=marine sediment metagenome TaxID=412755 RepID=X1T4R8_9ZZZZ
MKTVSTTTRWEVKPKPKDFPALTDSGDPQLEISPAEPAVKDPQAQDLQKPGPGAREYPLLEKFIKVPIPAGHKGRLSVRQWYLLAVLDGHQGDREYSSPSIIRLALECRVSERQVKRWLAKLKRLKYIGVDGRGKRNRYRVIRTRRVQTFVFVDPRWVEVLV